MKKIKDVHGLLFLQDQVRIGSGEGYVSMIENPKGKYTAFLKALRYGVSTEQIINSEDLWGITPSEAEDGLLVLSNGGYIENVEQPPSSWSKSKNSRFETNLNFFSTMNIEGLSKYDIQNKIQDTTILILGVGGIGSNICLSLLELGVGKIVATDFDTVERKNLNRQVMYTESSIGKRKIMEAAKFAAAFNSETSFIPLDREINSIRDVLSILDVHKPDIVINVADYPTGYIDFWVNEACVQRSIPLFAAGVDKKNGKSYSVIPYYSACYYCQYLEELERNPSYKDQDTALKTQQGEGALHNYRSPNGALGPSCMQQASFIAFEVLRFLFWGPDSMVSFNKICMIDYLSNKQTYIKTHRQEDCPVCGGSRDAQ